MSEAAPAMNLDKRQRAMLREMGIRVWQPLGADVPAAHAGTTDAAPMRPPAAPAVHAASDRSATDRPASAPAPVARPAAVRAPAPAAPAAPRSVPGATPQAAWTLGAAQPLYAWAPGEAPVATEGPRWLVLAEMPVDALQGEPFQGEAGKLLDNMLRAARLHHAGGVMLAPLVRLGAAAAGTDLPAALAAQVGQAAPDVILVMGRLAAQALLQSSEPLGKLRGQVHTLHGVQAVVTYDANFLLRSPLDKGKAWEDLCLAMSLAG